MTHPAPPALPLVLRRAKSPDGLPLLMVALNMLLLCFFVLLNSLATRPDRPDHATDVLARVREGYDVQAPQPVTNGTTPEVARQDWTTRTAQQLQGLVVNRLQLTTLPLEVSAESLTLTLPAEGFFTATDALADADLLLALRQAAPGAEFDWEVQHPDPTRLTRQVAALAQAAQQGVTFRLGDPALQLSVTPGITTPAESGLAIQQLGASREGQTTGSQARDAGTTP